MLVSYVAQAAAQTPLADVRHPVLTVDACLSARVPDIERAFAVELGRRFGEASNDARAATRFVLGCAGEQVVIAWPSPTARARSPEPWILSSTPAPGHARLTAIAAVELAAPLWDPAPFERGSPSGAAADANASVAATVSRPWTARGLRQASLCSATRGCSWATPRC